jgi:putative intracellular protease/amidase
VDAGYDPVFVTPNGAMPHLDPASDDPKYFGGSLETYKMYKSFLGNLHLLDAAHSTVQNIDAFKSYDFTDYAAIFVPGGHAPMVDLIENRSLGAILRIFHSLNKLTALICHGPVSLISALDNPSQFVQALRQGDQAMARQLSDAWIYKGCEMTVFSDAEDANAEAKKFHGKMLYYPQDALAAAGGNMSEGSPGQSHIIQCGELLTGQNPQSDSELAERMVQLLKSR